MAGVIQEHIDVVPGPGGPKARIAGHRIRVQDVVIWHEKLGLSPDEIVHQYPALTLADVYAAPADYWDHRAEIERAIDEERVFAEAFRRGHVTPLEERRRQQPA